ncbi:4-hydroxythreonine-4-phosphate dehydrogenase PdxA [Pontixanthobacter aestiaquae]|uniref:4-hydroxythreonine-4-phosphate dehydrogenase n=1 Tax=Pontixanthobacter aestiaquae TaxID=1509367 RepID=A0A844ZAM1_9SPHN|nr:4-hydroxythreonine-4-phosphate dehydrogenase PdxA [Pontixanthobacter aestiaquae]MDN3644876.1 4-hydroxythreonine-4-phosphate dehydrogenase PdxA [Pontixanthobacter aestiaquae]MXO84123.1 4-hydroxythreonine-4-phosphate dehydrogenase PdxA [Pontixanthobacter aestiaquae]
MSANPLPLAVSLGDPAGIGPELIARIWQDRRDLLEHQTPFFVVGGASVLDEILGTQATAIIGDPAEATAVFGDHLPVLSEETSDYRPGQPDDEGAALALHSLADATRHALLGTASAVVTAPVAKAQLARVGFEYPGQTEFLADVCGLNADDAVMMLAGPSLRAVPLTVHVALADVAALLTTELIQHKARITAAALRRDFGIANPRIAITGLNPHASEDGKFGSEEREIIAPAIEALRDEGLDVTGPHPADAVFSPRAREGYDAALCMYHDQALIPVKALDFDQGVNVTLGLPIIRTSPDHGTAFDIAGKDIADPGAMIAAIKMASECAARRADA